MSVRESVGKTGETHATATGARIEMVPIDSLDRSGSPRLDGIDEGHAELLAVAETELPPIVVDRRTRRIIDGHHRVRAAVLRGDSTVPARLIDAPPGLLFMLAVRANIGHGLPLSYADRRAAAAKILGTHPNWSDRAIARASGVSARVVAALRDTATTGERIGLDGRRRTDDVAQRRIRAAEALSADPTLSIRRVAASVGVSPSTVLDVRRRLGAGFDAVPERLRATADPHLGTTSGGGADVEPHRRKRDDAVSERQALLHGLKRDPALRYTESGRAVLRWVLSAMAGPSRCAEFVDEFAVTLIKEMPIEWREATARLARAKIHDWLVLAEELERRAATSE